MNPVTSSLKVIAPSTQRPVHRYLSVTFGSEQGCAVSVGRSVGEGVS